ncbi:MAG: DUF4251 domain-containing protein [Bacteroidaceae bacterium]|nr:DUF4251 domain-containing protein [Bacteroidaceae bacterium]
MKELVKLFRTKMMLVVSIVMASLIVSCSTMTTAEREAKNAKRAQYVAKVLDNRHYKIDVSMMNSAMAGSTIMTSDWSLAVRGDTLFSYLPYVGRAYEASYGTTKGLNFTAPILSYQDNGFVKGKRVILLSAKSDEDTFQYRLEILDNGSTSINVIARKRENINFSGDIAPE